MDLDLCDRTTGINAHRQSSRLAAASERGAMSRFDSAKAIKSDQALLSGFEALKQRLGRLLTLPLQKLQMRLNPQLVGLRLTRSEKSFWATSES
jgi:hypothetical protein